MKHILKPLFSGLLGAALSLSLLPEARAQSFTYTYYPNDATINNAVSTDLAIVGFAGGSYDSSFNPNFTGPSSPTIQVVAGANVSSEIDIFNHSVVTVSGGNVAGLVPYNNSTLNITGGSSGFVLNEDAAIINMNGGSVDDLEGQGKQINVSGGTMGTLVANVNTDFFGNPLGSCLVNVTGGTVTGEADAYNGGILNLYGGVFGGSFYAYYGGTINIYGTGLSATLLDANYHNSANLYSLSGTLEDGSVLAGNSLFIEHDGDTYGHSSFNLINAVPEPGSLALLLGVGVSGLSLLKRRRLSE